MFEAPYIETHIMPTSILEEEDETTPIGNSEDLDDERRLGGEAARKNSFLQCINLHVLRIKAEQQQPVRHKMTRGVAVLIFDIEDLDKLNRGLGWETGNMVIAETLSRLQAIVEEVAPHYEANLHHLNGGGYGMVIGSLSSTAPSIELFAERTAKKALAAMQRPLNIGIGDTPVISIRAHAGATWFPNDPGDANMLLKNARRSATLARHSGTGRLHVFDVEADRRFVVSMRMADAVSTAVDEGRLVLHFQPKISFATGEYHGCEALARIVDPEKGIISPGQFMPHIDQSDAIYGFADAVVGEVIKQVVAWNAALIAEGISQDRWHEHVRVAINLNARQLESSELINQIHERLRTHPSISPRQFEFEIVETIAISDRQQVVLSMNLLRDLGCRFHLDDFGTGYSSLEYIKGLPLDAIKIDQSFIINWQNNTESRAVVAAAIAIAKAFEVEVIAEGVEKYEVARLLRAMGCDTLQGYAVAKPMTADDYDTWRKTWSPAKFLERLEAR
jgi:EAL domain-containing protein (putative c-di-GMP-specific phosphodiesterase class I)/GGDEF domain-containing protein